jgi:PAS domain S-box-containing protein
MSKNQRQNFTAEDLLSERKAFLDHLFTGVPEAVVLLDTNDRVVQINPEFTKIFGYLQEEACGHFINELIVPEECLAEAEDYTRRGLRGESLKVQAVRKHKDGTRIHVSIISSARVDCWKPNIRVRNLSGYH